MCMGQSVLLAKSGGFCWYVRDHGSSYCICDHCFNSMKSNFLLLQHLGERKVLERMFCVKSGLLGRFEPRPKDMGL